VIQFVGLTASLFALITALAVAALYPLVRRRILGWEPARRARVLTALAVAPIAVGLLHTALCLTPGVLGTVWPALDHCLYHSGHPHLCIVHLAGVPISTSSSLLLMAFVAAFAVPFAATARRIVRTRRLLRVLADSAHQDGTGARVVDSVRPFAATSAGGGVLVSRALVDRLDPALLPAVIEHERAHAERRDPARRAIAALLASAHLPATRRVLLEDLELASEQVCDEQAGERLGDRLLVARALLAVERLMGGPDLELTAPRFGGGHLAARVHALLAPPQPAASTRKDWAWLAFAVALSVLLTDRLHHLAETLIGMLIA